MTFVVDTNVAIVANGRDTNADMGCQLTCVERLRSLTSREIIAIDDAGAIIEEYQKRLNFSGMPGVGDAFLKHVFNHQYQTDRVRRVPVTPTEDDGRGFEELPANTFDRSDRKFLAVAFVGNAVVLNATDSDWSEHGTLMDALGVIVTQLCPGYLDARARRRQ